MQTNWNNRKRNSYDDEDKASESEMLKEKRQCG